MAAVLVQLLPLILGTVFAPLWVIIVLLMLASPRGVAKATAFVLGMTLTRLAQGVLFGALLTASPDAHADNGGSSPVVSTLLLVVGILLLIAAFHKWRKESDPDDPPPQWMQSIDQTAPLKALGLGALLVAIGPKLWVFTLSALGIISAAELGPAGAIAAYGIYIIFAQILLILAILVSAIAPQAASTILQRAIGWLTQYNRPISIAVALIFGLYFIWDGAKGLLA
ncbi:MAG: hypothetical protein HGA45_19370 [Chloroflexales bacterium]|nr:hypothetical protein [Chloroflexales bacterium]